MFQRYHTRLSAIFATFARLVKFPGKLLSLVAICSIVFATQASSAALSKDSTQEEADKSSAISENRSLLQDALASFDQAEYQSALNQLESLYQKNPNDAEITYYLARSYFKARQVKKAHDLLASNTSMFPEHAESFFLLGSVSLTLVGEVSLWKKLGMARQSIESWEKAVSIDEKHIEGRYAVASYLTNAPGIAGGDMERGLVQMELLDEISRPYYLLVRAFLSAKEKQPGAAESYFQQAIPAIPDRAFPTFLLAEFYFQQENYNAALTTLSHYRQRNRTWDDPDESRTALLAGRIYAALDKPLEAKQELELARQLNPFKIVLQQIEKELDDL